MSKEVILTGLRTNSEYHLGNYIGAILPMVHTANSMSDEYQINMFVPDLHSFTTEIDHSKLHGQTMHNLKVFVACGLPMDNDNIKLYRQSYIPAHSELTIIMNNFAYMGELSRMTQYKDKSDTQKYSTVGLFDYPVLMACDILLYGANWIPVGEDQRQHLEFTRDIATRFNNKFGETFVVPKSLKDQQAFIDRDAAPRIRSLRNPTKKMSKSVEDPSGTIQLSDSPEIATAKIMKAETDNLACVKFDWDNQPGITNLLQILSLLSGIPQAEVNSEWENSAKYGELKTKVARVVSETLEDIQTRLKNINDGDLLSKLESSEQELSITASDLLNKVQIAVGLRGK